MCFKMRKLSGFIFHFHLLTEDENFESSVMVVKLLRYCWGSLENHTGLGDGNMARDWGNS
jgi:hypothetical protein